MEANPGMISFVAGKPNPQTFPFAKISVSLKGYEDEPLVLEGASLTAALQYGMPGGHPQLVKVLYNPRSSAENVDSHRD